MLEKTEKEFLIKTEKLQNILKYLYSDYFLIFLAIMISIFWITNQYIAGIFIIILISSILLVLQKDVYGLMPFIIMTVAIIPVREIPQNIANYWWVLIPLVLAICFHFVYYRNNHFSIGRLTIPLLVIVIVCILGGINSTFPQNKMANIYSAIWIGLLPLCVYLVLINYSKVPSDISISKLNAKTFLYFGLLIVIEIIMFYIKNISMVIDNPYQIIHLGWGISNTIATVLLFVFPMGFYLFIKTKGIKAYGYLLLGIIEYLAIIATTSRGSLIVGSVEFGIALISTIFLLKGRSQINYIIFLGILFMLLLAFFAVAYDKIKELINIIFVDGFNDNGRFGLYEEAIECFKQFPIFGAGLGFIGHMTSIIDGKGMYFFHNTILQILGSLGIVGAIGYLYYYIVRVIMLFEKWNSFNLYVIIAYVGFEGYSMLNTGTFQGLPFCVMVVIITATIEINSKLKYHNWLLEIINKRKNRSNVQILQEHPKK